MTTPKPDPLALILVKVLDAYRMLECTGRLTPFDVDTVRFVTRQFDRRHRHTLRRF